MTFDEARESIRNFTLEEASSTGVVTSARDEDNSPHEEAHEVLRQLDRVLERGADFRSTEGVVTSEGRLRAVLDQISFAPSCVNMAWQWQIEELRLQAGGQLRGWLINTTFRRPDTHTGEIGVGSGRQELIPCGASETAVVKTCWLLAELIVRHELMEAFLYRGVRIFDPHHSVDELSMPTRALHNSR